MLQELLTKIEYYLQDFFNIRDFESWLVSNLQIILSSGEERAIKMANDIDADLVQFGEGIIDEPEFRDLLLLYSRDRIIQVDFYETLTASVYSTDVSTSVDINVPKVAVSA